MTKIKQGGVLRAGVENDPSGFDPMINAFATDAQVGSQLYSYLLVNLVGAEVTCDLCTSWKLEDGGKTMLFNLNKDAFFEDGSKVTAKDVVYSLKKWIGEIDGVVSPRCGVIKEYLATDIKEPLEAVDANTLKIHLSSPSAAVPDYMTMPFCEILKDGTTSKDLQQKSNGSGPFRVTKWDKGASVRLARTPNYWKKDANGVALPYLDGLEFVVVRDAEAMRAAVVTGRLDRGGNLRGAGPDAVKLFQEFEKQGKGAIVWKKAESVAGVILNVAKPPFDNPRLRQAVNLVLDRKSQSAIMFDDRTFPSLYIPPNYPGARTPEEVWNIMPGWGTGAKKQQEIDQAKQLMKDAGYGDGLSMTISCAGYSVVYRTLAEWSITQFQRIGIKADLKCYDSSATFFPVMSSLSYSAAAYLYGYGLPEPDIMLGSYFITGANRNWSGVSDPRIDAIFPKVKSEVDPQKRIKLVREAEDILLGIGPWGNVTVDFGGTLLWTHWKGWAPTHSQYDYNYERSYDARVQ